MRHVGEPLVDGLRCGPKAASIDHLALLVESAVMAPNVAEVDANRQLYLATLPGYFLDEVGAILVGRTGNELVLKIMVLCISLSWPYSRPETQTSPTP